ncbi:spindle pole body-associated protein sad1 [Colletotrichum tofieldiae]|uniref:Spindle pole body-associated protein sad1 n=1 Tax=Colletotrichum tofieldiae TaxID=708197 RepID=A0A161VS56_9PEZI|nr:spindle pole body-associated protein sad1 [Colletotrichum tofieldiae]
MPPKRRVRGDDDDMPIISRGGAAVTSNLPPLASRLDTSYGSAPSTALRNTRRGQRRDLQAIIKETLHDSDDPDDPEDPDDDDDGGDDDDIDDIDDGPSDRSRGTKRDHPPPMKSPSPKPVPQSRPTSKGQPSFDPDPDPDSDSDFEPDFGPGRESSESPDLLRDPSPDPTFVQSPPRQRLSARTAPSVERPSFHQTAPAPRQRVLPDVAPPRGPSPLRQQPLTKAAGSKGLAPPSHTGQRLSPSRGALLAASSRSVFARAISEESGSQHQERRSREPPEPTPTPDSIRTFGQESSLFGGADIGSTPSRLSRSPEEVEESPLRPMPPRSNQADQLRGPVRDPISEVVHQPELLDWPRQNATRPSQPEPPSTPPAQRFRLQSESPRHESPARSVARRSVARDSPRTNATPRQVSMDTASPSPAARSSSARLSNHVVEDVPATRPISTRPSNHVDEKASTARSSSTSPSNRVIEELSHLDYVPPSHVSPRRPPQQVNPGPARRNVPQLAANEEPAPTRRLLHDPLSINVVASRPGGIGGRSIRPSAARRLVEEKDNRPAVRQNGSGLFNSGMREKIRQEREQEKAQQEALRKERNARLQTWPRIYNTVYSWTHAPRPDSPPPRDEDSDDYDSPIGAHQQVPSSEFSWSTWILFKLADTFVDLLNFLFSPRSWLIKALLGILLVSFLGWGAVTGLNSAPALGLGGIQWYGLSDISHNLGQFIPLWMSRPSTVFSDEDKREYTRQQRNHEYELTKLTKASKLHEGSLSRLEEIVPKIVHMRLDKHGRPVVGEEFWHALRDLMKSDTEILTMDRGHGGYHFISEEHWRAIRDRLKKDPVYQSAASPAAPGPSTADIEDIAKAKFDKSWQKWLKTNDKQVAKILEPALKTSIPDKIGKDLEYKIEKIVKDRFKDKDTKDVVVTRNEFIRHLKSEFASHRNEVKAEAQELQKKLEHYINDAVKSASEQAPPAGVSRSEMIQVVDGMVRQAIANAGLEALAQGKIGVTWDRELRHQVNFLGRHTGVIIDDSATTPDYDPPVKGKIWSPTWLKGTQRDRKSVPASATLWNWEDEGDCWCGKVIVDKSGVELGVRVGYLLGHEIIPQHVVVEHILPGATLNPDARPKEIDVLAYITEINTRNRVKDFAAAHFPSSKIILPDGWVRIGHFTYESSDALNGVYVHKLSPELVSLGAVTDQIVLQIISNYGSDHTCLYRARLYGEKSS